MSLERKLSEIDARTVEVLNNKDGEAAMNLLAADMLSCTNCIRAAIRATRNRNGEFDDLHEDMRNLLGIKE